jgi:CHAD domain-containing protein
MPTPPDPSKPLVRGVDDAAAESEASIAVHLEVPPVTVLAGTGRAPDTRLALDPAVPLAIALHRVCLSELNSAITTLRRDPDERRGVHETRKSLKRLRAMLRLVRDTVGYGVYRGENVVLRDTGRRLSAVRSSEVLAKLARAETDALGGAMARESARMLVSELEERHDRAATDLFADRQHVIDLLTTLLCSRARFERWPLVGTDPDAHGVPRRAIPDDFGAVAPGVRRVYRRGKRAMAGAAAEPSTETFHEWRKRAKYLQYQLEALRPRLPDVIGGEAIALAELGEALGDEHDLGELAELLVTEPHLVPDDAARHALALAVATKRHELQRRALRLGARSYHEPPDAFVARLAGYWRASVTRP